MYLLDTNVCIDIIRKKPLYVKQKLMSIEPSEIHLSSISIAELEYGASKSSDREQNRSALVKFVSPFEIIDFTDEDAEQFGIIRAYLEKKGMVIGAYDMQIAAQALSRNLIVVTNNVREFKRVPGLKVENWHFN